MRTRLLMAVVVLALSIGTLTLARQPGDRPNPQGGEPPKPQTGDETQVREERAAKPRPRLATLRAEVELLQLEHEADVQILKELIQAIRQREVYRPLSQAAPSDPTDPRPATPGDAKPKATQAGTAKTQEEEAVIRSILEHRKKEFMQKTVDLNQKEIELEQLEAQFHGAG